MRLTSPSQCHYSPAEPAPTTVFISYSPEPLPSGRIARAGRVLLDDVVTAVARTLVFAAAVAAAYQGGVTFGPRGFMAVGVVCGAAVLIRATWVLLLSPAEPAGSAR